MTMTVTAEEVRAALADMPSSVGLICETYSIHRRVRMSFVDGVYDVRVFNNLVCRTDVLENAVETFNEFGAMPREELQAYRHD